VNNFFLLMRNMNVDMLLNMEMMCALLLLDRGHVDDLLHHHRNRHLNHLLNLSLTNASLGYNFGNMNCLVYVPDRNLRDLVNFLHYLGRRNFNDVLMHLTWVVGVIFLVHILSWRFDFIAVARGILRCTNFPGVFKSGRMDGVPGIIMILSYDWLSS
jgi:hypothetical protein